MYRHFDDPVASLLQSGIEHVLIKRGEDPATIHDHDLMQATHKLCAGQPGKLRRLLRRPHRRDFPSGQWNVLRLYYALIEAELSGNEERYEALKRRLKYSVGDIDWSEALLDYLETFDVPGGHQIPYVPWSKLEDGILPEIDGPIRIALVGDWGTGTEEARQLFKEIADQQPTVIVHLGDVYYAGTEREYQTKFLDLIDELARDDAGKRIPVLNLPGNHDMYSGGDAYYAALGYLNKQCRPGWHQHHSFFGLRDKQRRWQILGMDTAYYDHDPFTVNSKLTTVHPREQEWLRYHVSQLTATKGRTVLLSHHQPFSALEQIGDPMHKTPGDFYLNPNLYDLFQRLHRRGDIAGWFWGHEHRWALYDDYRGIPRGACIGHGAIPVLANAAAYENYRPDWLSVAKATWDLLTGSVPTNGLRRWCGLLRRVLAEDEPDLPERETSHQTWIRPDTGPLGVAYNTGFAMLDIDAAGRIRSEYYLRGEHEPVFQQDL